MHLTSRMKSNSIIAAFILSCATIPCAAQLNMPIIQTKFTADPAPYVHGDTVYLYTTHDEDGAGAST